MPATLAMLASLVGQSDIILSAPSCKTCRIENVVVVEIGKDPSAQEAAPDGLMGALQLGRNFLAVPRSMNLLPVVFGPDGKVVRVLGRRGGGPGEFNGPGLIALTRGDSVLIADGATGRFSVFDGSWKFARQMPMGGGYETWVPLADGRIIAGFSPGHSPTPEILTIMDPGGKRLGAFGVPTAADTAGGMMGPPLMVTDGRMIWSANYVGPYRVVEWNPTTRQRGRTWVRRGPEFLDKLTAREVSPTQRPQPHVKGLLRDGPLLWVLYSVPGKEWAKGLVQKEMPSHNGMVKMWVTENPDLVFDTIVEAIEIASGQLLASRRFDEHFTAIVSTGTLAMHRSEDSDGVPLSRLVKFELKR